MDDGGDDRRDDAIQAKYVQYSSVDNISIVINNLRQQIDIFYPHLTPAQRIGHYFAKDIQSIVGYLKAAVQKKEEKVQEMAKSNENWTKYFKLGTTLEFTPFQVEDMIEKRQKQIEQMNIELHKLRRRIQRLRQQNVRLYADEADEASL